MEPYRVGDVGSLQPQQDTVSSVIVLLHNICGINPNMCPQDVDVGAENQLQGLWTCTFVLGKYLPDRYFCKKKYVGFQRPLAVLPYLWQNRAESPGRRGT